MSRLGTRLSAAPRAIATRVPVLVALGVVTLILVGTAVLCAVTTSRIEGLELTRNAATAAAKADLVAMLSYDYQTVDRELPAAAARLTGAFKTDWDALVTKVVIPDAKAQRTATSATVADSAVESADPDQVVLLMFVNQTTRSQARPTPLISGSRVRVTMRRSGDRWLCAGVVPI